MLGKMIRTTILIAAYLALQTTLSIAQEEGNKADRKTSRFSHKGIKLSFGLGEYQPSDATGLDKGQGVAIDLGYGFNDNFTLWGSVVGAEHPDKSNRDLITEFAGVQLQFQHKFITQKRFQPYGKIGLAGYSLKDLDSTRRLFGAGFILALGTDLFFSRHFGFGFELNFMDIRYFREEIETGGKNIGRDIRPHLNRDVFGFLVTFTVQ
jgi:hypothetical protein